MLRNPIKRKRHPSPRAGADGILTKDQPITKSFVIKMVLIVALGGPVIATLIAPFVDQIIRNKVDDWMSVPDLFDSISIAPEEYAQLPPYWRQALAEITLRPKEEAVDAQKIIEVLKLRDIKLIDLLAPYATSSGILREKGQLSEHPMPELSYSDFSHLQNLGILEDVNNGRRIELKDKWDPDSEIILPGTTVYLHFKPKNQETNFSLEVTAFTSGGMQLIEALRVPSNIEYFEWFAKKLEEEGFTVELLTTGIRRNSMADIKVIQGRLERRSIPAWPP